METLNLTATSETEEQPNGDRRRSLPCLTLAGESGKDAEMLHRCVYATLNINEDESQAEQELRSFVESYYGAPYETLARTQSMCTGTGKRCITWLKDFVAAGAQTKVNRFGSAGQSAQLERCANDILPGVRA